MLARISVQFRWEELENFEGLQWFLRVTGVLSGCRISQHSKKTQKSIYLAMFSADRWQIRVWRLGFSAPVKFPSVFATRRLRRIINPARRGGVPAAGGGGGGEPQGVGRRPALRPGHSNSIVSGSLRPSASVVLREKNQTITQQSCDPLNHVHTANNKCENYL